MNKKADIPFGIIMAVLMLLTLLVILVIMGTAGGKMGDFLEWITGML